MGKKKDAEKNLVLPDYEGEEVEVKKENKVVSIIINVILVVAIVLAAMATYVSFVSTSGNGVPSIFGLRPFSIQTDSMYPTLKPGDLIIDRAVKDVSTLEKGDIITYWTVINGERVLNTHKIDAVFDGGGHLIFATKGDNSSFADEMTVHESEIIGKYWFRIAGVGKVFDYLQTSTGFLLVVVLPVFLFFLYHLVQFFRALFEYQNVKNRIKYEQERGRNEDILEQERKKLEENKTVDRAALEEELREKLRQELLADMAKQQAAAEATVKENAEAIAEKAEEAVAEAEAIVEADTEAVAEVAAAADDVTEA